MASNFLQGTRELIDKTWRSSITYGDPLLTRLMDNDQVLAGGTQIEQIYESANYKSVVQEYGPNTGLVGGKKEIIERPHWHYAHMQCPVEEDLNERLLNLPDTDARLVKLREKIAGAAVKGIKYQILDRIYGCAVDNELDAQTTYLQGLCSALFPCESAASTAQTYGGIARTTTVNTEWCAASDSAWDTAYAMNKNNIDTFLSACREFDEDGGKYIVLCGTTLYNRFKQILEASNMYTVKGTRASQGFDSMEYSGVEITEAPYLDRIVYTTTSHNASQALGGTGTGTTAGLTGVDTYAGTQALFVLNLDTWHLWYSEDTEGSGPFELTDFVRQSDIEGGVDKMLARVYWHGNLTCDMPNRNMYRANMA